MSDLRTDVHQGTLHAEIEEAKEHAEEGGEGNWLVSYADMMTLLVGFFVILLSFSRIDQEQLEALKKVLSIEFGGSYHAPFGTLADRIRAELDKQGLGNQYVIKQNESGVIIAFRGSVFFDLGSAALRPEGQKLLASIIPVIKANAKTFDITVEGHTDDVPIGAEFKYKSNWELSSIRACNVLESFEKAGFDPAKITAIGYGESRPIVPNHDTNGIPIPKNRDANRRVLIKIQRPSDSAVGVVAPAPSSEHE